MSVDLIEKMTFLAGNEQFLPDLDKMAPLSAKDVERIEDQWESHLSALDLQDVPSAALDSALANDDRAAVEGDVPPAAMDCAEAEGDAVPPAALDCAAAEGDVPPAALDCAAVEGVVPPAAMDCAAAEGDVPPAVLDCAAVEGDCGP